MCKKMVYAVKPYSLLDKIGPQASLFVHKGYLESELFLQSLPISMVLQLCKELGLEPAWCATAIVSLNEYMNTFPQTPRLLGPQGEGPTTSSTLLLKFQDPPLPRCPLHDDPESISILVILEILLRCFCLFVCF